MQRTVCCLEKHDGLRLRIGRFRNPRNSSDSAHGSGSWKAGLGKSADGRIAPEKLAGEVEKATSKLFGLHGVKRRLLNIYYLSGKSWTPGNIARLAPTPLTRSRSIPSTTSIRKSAGSHLSTLKASSAPKPALSSEHADDPLRESHKGRSSSQGTTFSQRRSRGMHSPRRCLASSGRGCELKELRWRRYATGLFQPLGLKIVDDVVHVLGRDRITKLHDDNADGFADRYENFCDLYETSPSGHDYITCLETDTDGNFYFVHAKHGVQKVSKDGTKLEIIATGLRNPNGLSVSPTGEITAAPQEGEWAPASAIFMVRQGDHFGYGGRKITPQRPLGYDPPLCWIPRLVDNSCGGQCWVPDDSWGLPAGSLLHFSFGQCTRVAAPRESIDSNWQGGVIPLPWKFQSGLSRGRFSPHDGQLSVSGLKGWDDLRGAGRLPAASPLCRRRCPLAREDGKLPQRHRVHVWLAGSTRPSRKTRKTTMSRPAITVIPRLTVPPITTRRIPPSKAATSGTCASVTLLEDQELCSSKSRTSRR